MVTKQELKGITWVDASSPTKEEVRALMEEYSIHPTLAEELLLPSIKPKVDRYDNCIYLIMHFPALRHTHTGSRKQEIDFVLGKRFIITVHYDTIDPLHKFSKVFEVSAILEKADAWDHAGHLFFFLARKLYRAVMHELEYVEDLLHSVEERIFNGNEKEMVTELSNISRDVLNIKQALLLHRDIMDALDEHGREFFGEEFGRSIDVLAGEYRRVLQLITNNRSTLEELRATNNSLVYTKQNEVMKVLTIMAFVTFPLSLLAGIFGMNTAYTPIVNNPYGFWIIVSIMAAAMVVFFSFFKYKKWL